MVLAVSKMLSGAQILRPRARLCIVAVKPCAQMSSCAEAQYQLNVCGCSKRDADKDGVACDSDCQ